MLANLLILTAIGAFVLYRHAVRPKKLDNGEWQVVDHSDGTLRTLVAFFALLIGTQWAMGLGIAILEVFPKNPGPAALGLLGLVVGYGWLLWYQGRKVLEALHANPGELRVADWPLAAGEEIEVTYRRKLHRGRPAGNVQALLVHYEVAHYHHGEGPGRHGPKSKRVIKKVRLDDGEASYTNKELVASWRFQVPNTMGNPIEALQRTFTDMLLNRHQDDEWWELEIEMPLAGGTMLDSQFKLDISYIEGRTQFHMGA